MPARFEYARIFWSLADQPEAEPKTSVTLPDGSEREYPTRLAALNELGKDGWELVALSSPTLTVSSLYLKRQIAD